MAEAIPAAPNSGLRDVVLAGNLPTTSPAGPPWSSFLQAAPADAVALWFGDIPRGLRYALDRDIIAVDRMIATQVDAVLHHERVLTLEGCWRGLRWLVDQIEDGPGDRVIVRVMTATWREIERDMQRADDFDQSDLFRIIYEEEFGQAGGNPFGLMVVDHEVRHQPDRDHPIDDTVVLRHLAEIASAAFAPMVLSAAPELLGVETFADLAASGDPAAILTSAEHARWRRLRERPDPDDPDTRFLALALPRVLARPHWPDDGVRGDGFHYRERATSVAQRVWMSAAYPFAAVVARAAARFGWPADIRGSWPADGRVTDADRIGGGLVTGLSNDPHRLSQTLSLPRLPLEVVFTDRQERKLIEAGLMPLGALPHGDELLFGAVRSLYQPPSPPDAAGSAAFADSRLAAQINATLCASRFAHYLKIRGRETIGRLRQPNEIEFELRHWLTGFVNRNTLATSETRATHPLYNADVSVSELPGRPGAFNCRIMLQPYFQLDNVTASFDFETDILPHSA